MLKSILKFLKALASDASPNALATAVVIASIMGMTPLMSPHNLLMLFILLFFNVHLTTFLVLLPVFSLIGLALDPLFDQLGYALLTMPSLTELWTAFYNTSVGRLSGFNNSVLFGSLVVSLGLAIPLFILAKILVNKYRATFITWLNKTKLMSILKSTAVFKLLYEEQMS